MVPVTMMERIDEEVTANGKDTPESAREVEMIRSGILTSEALAAWIMVEVDKREEERWPIRSRNEAFYAINRRWGINGTIAEEAIRICELRGVYF